MHSWIPLWMLSPNPRNSWIPLWILSPTPRNSWIPFDYFKNIDCFLILEIIERYPGISWVWRQYPQRYPGIPWVWRQHLQRYPGILWKRYTFIRRGAPRGPPCAGWRAVRGTASPAPSATRAAQQEKKHVARTSLTLFRASPACPCGWVYGCPCGCPRGLVAVVAVVVVVAVVACRACHMAVVAVVDNVAVVAVVAVAAAPA